MEKLKALFGSDALTFEQLEEKLKDNKEVKLANLATGNYVDKKKHEDKVNELTGQLTTANNTISGLQDTVKKFDGVDIEKLKKDAADWETKYNTDVEAVTVKSMAKDEVYKAKAKDPEMILKLLDMSAIKRDGEKLIGISEQLDTLKQSYGYAFDLEEQPPKGPTFSTGGNHGGTNNIDTFAAAIMKGAGLETKGE